MSYNAANRKDVRRLEKQARLDEAARLETTRFLMGTTNGRQWVFEHLDRCHVFASSFSLNAQEAAFKEGERNVGLRLLNDVMLASPDEYVQMMREENVRRSTSVAERSRGEGAEWGDQESGGSDGDSSEFGEG
jgi:hypothetical protein